MKRLRRLAPPPRFVAFALAVPPDASLVRSQRAWAPHSMGQGCLFCGALTRIFRMESTRPPRFLGNPCVHATLFDPGGPLAPRHCGAGDAAFRSENDVGSTILFPFEAQSRGLHPPCVRFVDGLTTTQRNTRFRAVASLSRDRTLTCRVPLESFRHVLHDFPFLQALPGAIPAETFLSKSGGKPVEKLWKACLT